MHNKEDEEKMKIVAYENIKIKDNCYRTQRSRLNSTTIGILRRHFNERS